jgi:hypothetical protein
LNIFDENKKNAEILGDEPNNFFERDGSDFPVIRGHWQTQSKIIILYVYRQSGKRLRIGLR